VKVEKFTVYFFETDLNLALLKVQANEISVYRLGEGIEKEKDTNYICGDNLKEKIESLYRFLVNNKDKILSIKTKENHQSYSTIWLGADFSKSEDIEIVGEFEEINNHLQILQVQNEKFAARFMLLTYEDEENEFANFLIGSDESEKEKCFDTLVDLINCIKEIYGEIYAKENTTN
jgi:hypothetical protein